MAKVLANMGEYGQSSSPLDLHAEEEPQEENSPEESHAKEAEEENLPVHDENKQEMLNRNSLFLARRHQKKFQRKQG